MFTSIIVLAALVGFFNILFIISSSFASRRRLRKDQYALVAARAGHKSEVIPVNNEHEETEELFDEYTVDGHIMYSKQDLLSQRFARVETGNEPDQRVQAVTVSRFSLADFK